MPCISCWRLQQTVFISALLQNRTHSLSLWVLWGIFARTKKSSSPNLFRKLWPEVCLFVYNLGAIAPFLLCLLWQKQNEFLSNQMESVKLTWSFSCKVGWKNNSVCSVRRSTTWPECNHKLYIVPYAKILNRELALDKVFHFERQFYWLYRITCKSSRRD